ncbi:MAG TPA: 50S ribosomal protein L29 [Planctomycetes bacterium]|nr:50S ribosomal protein L29 [Planctomycetota bacterium]HIN79859.1 50S ribosomal protein L29 [Planctomycetota bacterium]
MKTSDVRELPDADIKDEIRKHRERLFKIRFNAASEENQRAGEIRKLRRNVARMMSVLREREIQGAKSEGS